MAVKEQVTDISEALQTMTEGMRLMRKTIASQHLDICKLNRNIDKLNADLRKRDKQIEELKARLAKYEKPDKNSGNSNTPPSKESMKDEAIRRTKTLRKSTGRKHGGQKGHKGSTLTVAPAPWFMTLPSKVWLYT